jgi:dephospho-CoA kinase
MIIGLTGGIGSGKSAVERLWTSKGLPVLDTDHVSKALTAAGGRAMPELIHQFGQEYVDQSGALDRNKMRALVFADASARVKLETVLHRMILEQCEQWFILQKHEPIAVLAVPLLFERGNLLRYVDRSVVVDCQTSTQIDRVMRRSNLNNEAVEAVMRTQLTRLQRLAKADEIIDNEQSLADLEANAMACLQRLMKRATASQETPR